MGLFLSLHSVKDAENESANSVSLTLRAKGLVEIQIGSPSETITLSMYQYLQSNKIQADLACKYRYTHHSHIIMLYTLSSSKINVSISAVQLHEVFESCIKIYVL